MAIKYPPAPFNLRRAKWRVPFPAQRNRSGWTGTSKVIGLPGAAVWQAEGDFVTIVSEANMRPWRAFFLSLKGPVNKFPLRAVEAQQTTHPNPTVRAGGNSGTTVPLAGLPASTAVLPTGAMMTVVLPSGHHRLVCLMAPLNSNGSGQGTATFEPELCEVPAEGAAVEIQWPYGLMSLTSDPPGWDVEPGQTYTFPLRCEEAK
ncbi:hypothetical protein CA223_05495 [Sphingomonas koreensis]|uniref:Uncharacterized protein n=1 Tax=Sphingomonas koreensis TaxID=93064 RepID=A0A1L6JBV9_9SPHN|nr:hypothetical protein [Sphingomonas koreensis]APR53366.1 hypothetical protein BRX40_13850 [Sphingomonas koreensis]MDC7809948.1 hypothetical protein [Sphingomonas koreensis]RSU24511.1 hypothetical protein CA224_01985 [Sphingomonas koreensis]RSU25157.1 hypothetical protein CA222_13580 [Sphingomonas koreensis]RSU30168.1 hypothetical protein CA225_05770 [Sphingomonas koreensis]